MESFAKDALVVMLRKMLAIRYFEQSHLKAFRTRLGPGATHVYLEEEAVAVGGLHCPQTR